MTRMAISTASLGYSSLSISNLFVVTNTSNTYSGFIVHKWVGTGSTSLLADAHSDPFVVPHNNALLNFSRKDVSFSIGGGITGRGRTTFKFSIRNPNGDEIYNIAPNAPNNEIGINVTGLILSDVENFGQFVLVPSNSFLLAGEGRRKLIYDTFGVVP